MRRVKVGTEFEGEAKLIDAKSRQVVTLAITTIGTVIVVGSIVVGIYQGGNFETLKTVWSVLGPTVGLIVGYYFRNTTSK